MTKRKRKHDVLGTWAFGSLILSFLLLIGFFAVLLYQHTYDTIIVILFVLSLYFVPYTIGYIAEKIQYRFFR